MFSEWSSEICPTFLLFALYVSIGFLDTQQNSLAINLWRLLCFTPKPWFGVFWDATSLFMICIIRANTDKIITNQVGGNCFPPHHLWILFILAEIGLHVKFFLLRILFDSVVYVQISWIATIVAKEVELLPRMVTKFLISMINR